MPRPCLVCNHPDRETIDEELRAKDRNIASIANHFAIHKDSVWRHHTSGHVRLRETALALKGIENADNAELLPPLAAEEPERDDLASQVKFLQSRALRLLSEAEGEGDRKHALGAIREARMNIELIAEISGELERRGTVHIQNQIAIIQSPDWSKMRAAIVKALLPYPEAKEAVCLALEAEA